MCRVLEIPRSSYYKKQRNITSKRALENQRIKVEIKKIFIESKERYGSPRITEQLRRIGINCNRKRVARLMREEGLRAKIFRRYKVTTKSDHNKTRNKNILNGKFETERSNQIWSGDITYIRTEEGWLYLAAVMDIYSRKIVGWQTDKRITSRLVEEAMEKALRENKKPEIFHSDQGVQYASYGFRKILRENKISQSMSRRGNCYDNAITESFFHTLKTELVKQNKYKTRLEARLSLFEYIEIFYNRKRLHSSLGYLSPVEYEKFT